MEYTRQDDYKMYRCKFIKDSNGYIKAKDVFNNTPYLIKKSRATRHYEKGFDDVFYARLEISGLIIKKRILHVIAFEEYLKLESKLNGAE